jgi:hypothetical protein
MLWGFFKKKKQWGMCLGMKKLPCEWDVCVKFNET